MAGHDKPQLPGDRESRRVNNVLHYHVNNFLNANTAKERYRAARNWMDTIARYGSREVVLNLSVEMIGLSYEAWTDPKTFGSERTMPAEWLYHMPAPVHVPGKFERAVTRVASAITAVQKATKPKPRRPWF